MKTDNVKCLDEAVLKATALALQSESSDLVHHIRDVLAQKPTRLGWQRRGGAAHDNYEINLPQEVIGRILEVLKSIEAKHGYNKLFSEYQINALVSWWNKLA